MGARLALSGEEAVEVCDKSGGFVFLFAQAFHPSMRHVAGVRRQLGKLRTIFNVLGPLSNPARANYYCTGVYSASLAPLYAETFSLLPNVRAAMVVHSNEGLDELSIAGGTRAWIVRQGVEGVEEREFHPTADFGLPVHPLESVMGGEADENVATFRSVLNGDGGPASDYVVLNAAAALWISGLAPTTQEAARMAQAAISSGAARRVLESYIAASAATGERERSSASVLNALNASAGASILRRIADHRRDVTTATARAALPLPALLRRSLSEPPPAPVDIVARLRRGGARVAVMAEIKRASPSRGDIAPGVDVPAQALRYASAGAAAVSVLTEPHWFKGTVNDLRAASHALVRAHGDARPAVLLKDFVTEEYQLVEGRAAGADSALLIVALLDDARLRELMAQSRALGMEPLVEVATEEEMRRAVEAGARLVGINNRNLHDFTVDMGRTARLAAGAAAGAGGGGEPPLLCALSGIKTHDDVRTYADAGASAVLVGETLMRADDPAAKITELLGDLAAPLVKV